MAVLNNQNVIIKGISVAVPKNTIEIRDLYREEWGDVEEFIRATTIERLRISPADQTASDLCVAAAEKLIDELGWEKDSIEAIIFVTQTPDYYFVPATACHIQNRLGLTQNCLAFDVTLGCSGWIYGLGVLSSMMNSGSIRRALLLCGDTCSKAANPEDKSEAPLFGDAGTVTALEYTEGNGKNGIQVSLFTDGGNHDAIIIKEGGFRNPVTAESFPGSEDENGLIRPPFKSEMDGMSVFSFAITKVPKAIKSLLNDLNIDKDKIDILALHQANLLINQTIIKKMKLGNARYPQSLIDFGNTSCASIPLSLVSEMRNVLKSSQQNILACGFGVGLSWGVAYFTTDCIIIPELIEI